MPPNNASERSGVYLANLRTVWLLKFWHEAPSCIAKSFSSQPFPITPGTTSAAQRIHKPLGLRHSDGFLQDGSRWMSGPVKLRWKLIICGFLFLPCQRRRVYAGQVARCSVKEKVKETQCSEWVERKAWGRILDRLPCIILSSANSGFPILVQRCLLGMPVARPPEPSPRHSASQGSLGSSGPELHP